MTTTEDVVDSLTRLDGCVRLMGAASDMDGVLDVVRAYLSGWSPDRVRTLQALDGGWGPFDQNQSPAWIASPEEVERIGEQLSAQCAALREAGVAPCAELLEIDLFFFFAAESLEPHYSGYPNASRPSYAYPEARLSQAPGSAGAAMSAVFLSAS